MKGQRLNVQRTATTALRMAVVIMFFKAPSLPLTVWSLLINSKWTLFPSCGETVKLQECHVVQLKKKIKDFPVIKIKKKKNTKNYI